MTQNHISEEQERLSKLNSLKKAGIIPYANNYKGKIDITNIINQNQTKDSEQLMENGAEGLFKTAGRLLSFRSHGKLSFGKIIDNTGSIQICFVKDKFMINNGKIITDKLFINEMELNPYKFIEKMIDIGDIVGIIGDLFITKHGEKTLFVKEFQLLSKAIKPLPEKFHGITDKESIYRQRYLDLIMNEDSYQRFLLRSNLLRHIRNFYHENGFIEIETPILGNAASGAAAAPFVTHHNYYDQDFFLRISPETALKKATVGRFEKIFEVAKDFRNEGSDPSHMQEFTMIEHYAVYRNFEDNMLFTEQIFNYIFEKLKLPKIINIIDKEGNIKPVNFETPWEKIDYIKGIKDKTGIEIEKYGIDDNIKLRKDITNAGFTREGIEKQGTTTLIDYLFKKVLRPSIIGPSFVYNYPKTMQPLARVSDNNKNIVEQFQLIVNGWEIIKAYSELVDPIEQKYNFDLQNKALEQGDEEATSGDEEFVKAMEYGMPPQSGRGMGIDRLITLITGQENLRDSVLFPLMKPLKDS